jgi:hypothetical protein
MYFTFVAGPARGVPPKLALAIWAKASPDIVWKFSEIRRMRQLAFYLFMSTTPERNCVCVRIADRSRGKKKALKFCPPPFGGSPQALLL